MASDQQISLDALTQALTNSFKLAQGPKDVSFEEYVRRPGKLEPVLDRPTFQNGQPIQIKGCSKDTLKHVNGLRPGKYISDVVTVTVKGTAPSQEVHITYPCASNDDRLRYNSLFSSFSDLVQKISQEQKAEDDAEATAAGIRSSLPQK